MRVPLYSIQEYAPGTISVMARPRGGDWLIDEIASLRQSGVDIPVSLLTEQEVYEFDLFEEAAYCGSQGITYLSYPMIDRSVPAFSEQTFLFLKQLHASLAEGKHIAIHCRQGLGRAILVAASLLVLNNISAEQAFAELSRVRGCPVPETDEQRAWVVAFSRL